MCQVGGRVCRDVSNGWESMYSRHMRAGEHVVTCQVGGGVCIDVT
jgi:hypothetical protein